MSVRRDVSPTEPINENTAPVGGTLASEETRRLSPAEQAALVTINSKTGTLDNLPMLLQTGLAAIGKNVCFKCKVMVRKGSPDENAHPESNNTQLITVYYEGVVMSCNAMTVSLMQVSRWRKDDFVPHLEEERNFCDYIANEHQNARMREREARLIARKKRQQSKRQKHGNNNSNNNDSNDEDEVAGEVDVLDKSDATGDMQQADHVFPDDMYSQVDAGVREENDYVKLALSKLIFDNTIKSRVRARENESYGPFPFFTCSRMTVRNVEFAPDPVLLHATCFRFPERYHFDMQFLRTMVRRYIVHSAQGNNTHNTPLKTFLKHRCNYAMNTEEKKAFIAGVVRDEAEHLILAEQSLRKEDERRAEANRSRMGRLNEINGIYGHDYESAVIFNNRVHNNPPSGMFRFTGLLYYTPIPLATFIVGALCFIIACAMLLTVAISNLNSDVYVIRPLAEKFDVFLFAPGAVWLVLSFMTVIHSTRLSLSFGWCYYVVRAVLVVGSLACVIMAVVVSVEYMVPTLVKGQIENRIIDNDERYPYNLRYFYSAYECSGWSQPCTGDDDLDDDNDNEDFCEFCMTPSMMYCRSYLYSQGCEHAVMRMLRKRMMGPVIIAAVMLFAVAANALIMLVAARKSVHLSRLYQMPHEDPNNSNSTMRRSRTNATTEANTQSQEPTRGE